MVVTAAADVVTADTTATGCVVPLSVSFLVVSTGWVRQLGLLCMGVEVVSSSWTAVTSIAAVLVRRVASFVVASLPAVESWRWLDGVVGCGATDDCGAQLEGVEGGFVCSSVVAAAAVALVGDDKAAVLGALLRTEGEVAAAGGVTGAVVVGVAPTAGVEAPTVSSSVT